MEAQSAAPETSSPIPVAEKTSSDLPRRSSIWFWRLGTILCLAALGYLWVRSWSQVDLKFFALGKNGLALHLAGSSCAISISNPRTAILEAIPTAHIDRSRGLSVSEVKWIDGDSAGTVEHSTWATPFPPVSANLDPVGSFAAGYFKSSVFHLRFPIWVIALSVIAGWLWIETFVRRRRSQRSG